MVPLIWTQLQGKLSFCSLIHSAESPVEREWVRYCLTQHRTVKAVRLNLSGQCEGYTHRGHRRISSYSLWAILCHKLCMSVRHCQNFYHIYISSYLFQPLVLPGLQAPTQTQTCQPALARLKRNKCWQEIQHCYGHIMAQPCNSPNIQPGMLNACQELFCDSVLSIIFLMYWISCQCATSKLFPTFPVCPLATDGK